MSERGNWHLNCSVTRLTNPLISGKIKNRWHKNVYDEITITHVMRLVHGLHSYESAHRSLSLDTCCSPV